MSDLELSIIIVNWNSKDYVRSCISSIYASKLEIRYEIIVIDSGSFDGCGPMLQRFDARVRFLQSKQNLGFGRANNLGATIARGRVLLFLNPDTEVKGEAIGNTHSYLEGLQHAGVIGCRLVNTDGSLQASCVQPLPTILNQGLNAEFLQRLFPRARLWMSARMFEDVHSPVPVEAISGAYMMIRREVFDRVHGFSTDYFMYGEDLDLCYKTRTAGFTNFYIRDLEVVHHGGGSSQLKHNRFSDVMIPESISRLLRKTHGGVYSRGYRLALSGVAVFRLGLLLLGFPAMLINQRALAWGVAFQKWIVVFRWSIGLEKWVYQYDQCDSILNDPRDVEVS